MDLRKVIKLPNDVVVGFLQVQNTHINHLTNLAYIYYKGWVTEDTFIKGKAFALEGSVVLPMEEIPGMLQAISELSGKLSDKLDEEISQKEAADAAAEVVPSEPELPA